jgi:hypothetical protein
MVYGFMTHELTFENLIRLSMVYTIAILSLRCGYGLQIVDAHADYLSISITRLKT